MIEIRRANERGHTKIDWLDSWHTFSFDRYNDPSHMNFRHLRVINEDYVEAGQGFSTHPHRDMEILTYVLEGALEHRDSMGNGSLITPGEVQRMSAGSGVTHSEYNPSKVDSVHLLQIWIVPETRGQTPSYQQRLFEPAQLEGNLRLIAARDGRDGAITIHQDVDLFAARLKQADEVTYQVTSNRYVWLQIARGRLNINGQLLNAGDGAAISSEKELKLIATDRAELLLFDLA